MFAVPKIGVLVGFNDVISMVEPARTPKVGPRVAPADVVLSFVGLADFQSVVVGCCLLLEGICLGGDFERDTEPDDLRTPC